MKALWIAQFAICFLPAFDTKERLLYTQGKEAWKICMMMHGLDESRLPDDVEVAGQMLAEWFMSGYSITARPDWLPEDRARQYMRD